MKNKRTYKTTTDFRTFRVARLGQVKMCTWCGPHNGCNIRYKKEFDFNGKHYHHVSWKVKYKDKKQWMKNKKSGRKTTL